MGAVVLAWPPWPGAAGLGVVAAVLGLLVAALALLAAATGLCTGCEIYKLSARLRGIGHGHFTRIDPATWTAASRPTRSSSSPTRSARTATGSSASCASRAAP